MSDIVFSFISFFILLFFWLIRFRSQPTPALTFNHDRPFIAAIVGAASEAQQDFCIR